MAALTPAGSCPTTCPPPCPTGPPSCTSTTPSSSCTGRRACWPRPSTEPTACTTATSRTARSRCCTSPSRASRGAGRSPRPGRTSPTPVGEATLGTAAPALTTRASLPQTALRRVSLLPLSGTPPSRTRKTAARTAVAGVQIQHPQTATTSSSSSRNRCWSTTASSWTTYEKPPRTSGRTCCG